MPVAPGRGVQYQRVSAAVDAPASGVKTSPSPPPASAASCKRRLAVKSGAAAHSAITIGAAPERRASSADHNTSRGQAQAMMISRPGSKKAAIPCGYRVSPRGADIHITGPLVAPQMAAANPRAAGPQASCTRPLRSRMPSIGDKNPIFRLLPAGNPNISAMTLSHTGKCSLYVLIFLKRIQQSDRVGISGMLR